MWQNRGNRFVTAMPAPLEPSEIISLTVADGEGFELGIIDGDRFELVAEEYYPIELAVPDQIVIVGDGSSLPAGVVLRVPAAADLSGHRVLIYSNGSVGYADNLTASHAYLVIGISQSAAMSGAPVDIYNRAIVTESGWSWTAGQPVFCGANGMLTQVPPAPPAQFLLIVGMAIASNQLSIEIQEPIFL
jgi:hypothetical protein